MTPKFGINVRSEIGELEGVIIHTPGQEVENMTPKNAERALYSDILNLSVAGEEYDQFKRVLQRITKTYEVTDLLTDVLSLDNIKEQLIKTICQNEEADHEIDKLLNLDPAELGRQLIEGVILNRNNLTNFLNKERYVLKPLHNFFFTRDASISVLDEVLIGKMANKVRERESIIMETIFKYHPLFGVKTCNPAFSAIGKSNTSTTIEGGDVLVVRDDILVIGTGCRTSTQGIDFIIDSIKARNRKTRHILVKELPYTPESFIHLDMVFTFLDRDSCMVFEPLIIEKNRYQTIHITIENGAVSSIRNEGNILKALKKLGIDLKPISCGGNNDPWIQEREQWHSGANFFAFAPGKVIGYERNIHTLEEMNKNGFEILKADDVISGQVNPFQYNKCVVTIAGSELARGGGGARCMTMPLKRKNIDW